MRVRYKINDNVCKKKRKTTAETHNLTTEIDYNERRESYILNMNYEKYYLIKL